jgi:hypothetical protein
MKENFKVSEAAQGYLLGVRLDEALSPGAHLRYATSSPNKFSLFQSRLIHI